jgi:hypothetical protein
MNPLIRQIKSDYPDISFERGSVACWSPLHHKVFFVAEGQEEKNVWALLHELGHVQLSHSSFRSDFDLLSKEVEAWEEAKRIASHYSITIDEEHIQDCLDTYRDWLHLRSKCPVCDVTGVQNQPHEYTCINCQTCWQVSGSRHARPYRTLKTNRPQS